MLWRIPDQSCRTGEQGLKMLKGLSPEARNLARLLIERRRIGIIGEVPAHHDALADKASGVVRAEVITAVTVDKALEKHIANRCASSSAPTSRPPCAPIHPSSAGS